MDTLIRQLSHSTDVKVYRPQFKRELKSVTSAILLNQIIYWWHKMGYKPFYKFIEPCQHPLYSEGSSWCEELEFSKKEFLGAIAKLKDRGIVSSKRDNNNKVWYSVNNDALSEFLTMAYSTNPKDTVHQDKHENVHRVLQDLEHSASDAEAKLTQLKQALGYENITVNSPKFPKGNTPVSSFLSLTSIYRRLQQKNTTSAINLAAFKYEIISEINPYFSLGVINKEIPPSPLLEEKEVHHEETTIMDHAKLTKLLGGKADIAAQLQPKLPSNKGSKHKVNQNAIFQAWRSAYSEVSDSFVGSITKKEEAMLKHIAKDYPEEAVQLLEHCVLDWQAFGNHVIRMAGISMAPQMPSIAFLSSHREHAHSFYKKAVTEGSGVLQESGVGSAPVNPAPQQKQPDRNQDFTSVSDLFE